MGCNCDKNTTSSNFSLVKAISSGSSAISIILTSIADFETPFVSDEIMLARIEKCKQCELHTMTLNKLRCGICGCFINIKATLKNVECPHPEGSKWQDNE